jgi:hypothetical protein
MTLPSKLLVDYIVPVFVVHFILKCCLNVYGQYSILNILLNIKLFDR